MLMLLFLGHTLRINNCSTLTFPSLLNFITLFDYWTPLILVYNLHHYYKIILEFHSFYIL